MQVQQGPFLFVRPPGAFVSSQRLMTEWRFETSDLVVNDSRGKAQRGPLLQNLQIRS